SQKRCKATRFGFVDRDRGLDAADAPDTEPDMPRRAEVAGHAEPFRGLTLRDRDAAEVLDDLQALDRAAPRAEAEAFLARGTAAPAFPHLSLPSVPASV